MNDRVNKKHIQKPGENHPQDPKKPPRRGSGRNRLAKGYDAFSGDWIKRLGTMAVTDGETA